MTNVHARIWSRTTTHDMHARGLAALRLQLIYIVQQTSMALACAKKNQPPVADVHAFAVCSTAPAASGTDISSLTPNPAAAAAPV